jgi:putative intracellular protease/amidase
MRVAILATNGFEQAELEEPRKASRAAGAQTALVSPKSGRFGPLANSKNNPLKIKLSVSTRVRQVSLLPGQRYTWDGGIADCLCTAVDHLTADFPLCRHLRYVLTQLPFVPM